MRHDVLTAADLFPPGESYGGHFVGPALAAAMAAKQADPLGVLTALPESPVPEALESALRDFAIAAGSDPLRRASLRGAAIETLRARKVTGPAAVIDAALGTATAPPEPDSGGALDLATPEPWPVAVAGGRLLHDLSAVIRRHVVLTAEQSDAVALWTIFAHAIDGARISPKLAITSPTPRCGKSTLLAVLAALVPRPLVASNISPAAVFRCIEAAHPTLLVDEADSFLRDNEPLRGILNSGHSRDSAFVIRCDGEANEPRRFSTWCGQAIGLIGSLPATLADRSIEIRLQRKRSGEPVAKLTRHSREGLAMLARQAARWAADNPIDDASPEMPGGMNDRASDNWEHLLALADLAGGEWTERARRAAVALSGGEPADAQAVGVTLLADIRTVFEGQKVDRLASADLTSALGEMEDRPWPEWRHGKPMTAPQLARQLGHFGVSPRTIRLASGTAKGYLVEQFAEAWSRYIPSFPPDAPSQTVTPSQPASLLVETHFSKPSQDHFVTLTKSEENQHKQKLVTPVTVSQPADVEKDQNESPQRDLWAGMEVEL